MECKTINWSDFEKIEMRIGTILSAEAFDKAKTPAYKLKIDFGTFGILKSSAQITQLYTTEDLIGKQIVAVINFPPKQIANMMSECLILGALGSDKEVTLIHPGMKVKNGVKIQ